MAGRSGTSSSSGNEELGRAIGKFLLIAAGGVVPFLSFFTERYYRKVAEGWSERNDSA
jgi:hypothetical protein